MSQIPNQIQTQTQNMKRKIYRQGDVILEQIEYDLKYIDLYANLESNKLEIRSETGNAHVMNNIKLYRYHNQQLLLVENPTPLIHEQHPTLIISPGIYRLRFVRDFLLDNARPYD